MSYRYVAKISYNSSTQSGRPKSWAVRITDYARSLGLADYHPPLDFPQDCPEYARIRRDANRRIDEIRDAEDAGQISSADANASVLAILRDRLVVLARAAWVCKDPPLLVEFSDPINGSTYRTVRRLRHHGSRRDGTSSSLAISCGRAAGKLGLDRDDLIGVEILGFCWEGWVNNMTPLTPGYDGLPLWEWEYSPDTAYTNGCAVYDRFRLPCECGDDSFNLNDLWREISSEFYFADYYEKHPDVEPPWEYDV